MEEGELSKRLEQLLNGAAPSSSDPQEVLRAAALAEKLAQPGFAAEAGNFRRRLRRHLEKDAPSRLHRAQKRRRWMSILKNSSHRTASALVGVGLILLVFLLIRLVAQDAEQPSPTAAAGLASTSTSTQEEKFESQPPADPTIPENNLPPPSDTPAPVAVPYCEILASNYQPPEGWQLYCDENFEFAFDYPQDWVNELIVQGSQGSPPGVILRAQSFYDPKVWNMIRIETYRSGGRPANVLAQQYWAFRERAFPEENFDNLKVAGQPAYAIIVPWVHDTSGVYLFIVHGEYNTVIELKIPNREGLEVNWEIARSLQAPGATPAENYIPQTLIEKSFTVLP